MYDKYAHHFHSLIGTRLPNSLDNDSSNGHNNGFQHDDNDLGLILSISITSAIMVLAAVMFVVAVVIIAFVRTKSKVKNDLLQKQQNAIYEEIDIIPSIIEYDKNIAYDTAPSVAQ